jgi:hypothetical protein
LEESVKIAGAILAPTSLIARSRTFGTAGVSPLGDAASELTAFLSLVTGFLEKIPTATPGQIAPPPSSPSEATGAAVSKNKSKDPTSGLNEEAKNHKKEESLALPESARPLQIAMAFLTKTPVAPEFPTSRPGLAGGNEQFTSSENGNAGGLAQHPEVALHPSLTAPLALSPAAGNVAFALRLTPSGSETMNTPQSGIQAAPLAAGNSARLRLEVGPTPPQNDDPGVSATPAAPAGTDGRAERTSGPLPIPDPVTLPENTEEAIAGSGPLSLTPSTENIAAAKTDRIPDITSSLPGLNPAGELGMSQPESKVTKVEPAAKPGFQEFRLRDNHVEASGKTLGVPAWPSDAGGAPDTRGAPDTGAGSASADDSARLGVASEPEIKMDLAPPITRQISLKLSTDDSTQVNIGLTERAGKVLVAVRTSDHELAQSLQTGLGDLVGRLESKGFKTETWLPAVTHQEAVPLQSSNSNTDLNQPQHSGPGNGGGQQRQGQNSSTQRQKERWAAQLDETISADEARSES